MTTRSFRSGAVTDTVTGTATITAGAVVADIITAGAIIIEQQLSTEFALAIPLPGRGRIPGGDRSRLPARPVHSAMVSPAPSRPRSVSDRNDSWPRASA